MLLRGCVNSKNMITYKLDVLMDNLCPCFLLQLYEIKIGRGIDHKKESRVFSYLQTKKIVTFQIYNIGTKVINQKNSKTVYLQ